MSTHLRDDNECQNCGYTVDRAYCSNCGQKNTETRQPFHHLFTHFVEDLTHYDGAFWKTIKHLLFRPARLTREYLQGKRQTYVPPVKLYIFISFVTFFYMSLTGSDLLDKSISVEETGEERQTATVQKKKSEFNFMGYRSIQEMDSVQKFGKEDDKLPSMLYKAARGAMKSRERGLTKEDLIKQYIKVVPKVLFFYLPVFTFWLWVFHSKKRWYFFDHGIFTLHYFSAVLLLFFIADFCDELFIWIFGDNIGLAISQIISLTTMFYAFFYFFRAHRRMYGESRLWSRLKGFMLFLINMIFILIAFVCSTIYFFSSID